jgi:predicted nucleotidyltransferase
MELARGIDVDDDGLRRLCVAHRIRRLSLFGSALRQEHRPDSDVDLLVEFQPGQTPGLLGIAELELALEGLLGRPVEVRTLRDLSRYFRDEVAATARPLYDAA